MSIESSKEKKSELDLFQEEISEIKKKEMEKKKKSKGKDYNPHFDNINPEDLTEKDREIYGKFEGGSMTSEDLEKYRKSVFSRIDEAAGITEKDRDIFEKFKKGEVSRDEFLNYCDSKAHLSGTKEISETRDSRANFCAWLINKIGSNKSWLEKFKQESR